MLPRSCVLRCTSPSHCSRRPLRPAPSRPREPSCRTSQVVSCKDTSSSQRVWTMQDSQPTLCDTVDIGFSTKHACARPGTIDFMNVLAICAHPDDETLGCGGTLLKHRAAGDELFWIIATVCHEPQWSAEL